MGSAAQEGKYVKHICAGCGDNKNTKKKII